MTPEEQHKEDRAVEALVALALHVEYGDVTEGEIRPYIRGEVTLSAEDDAALKRLTFPLPP